MILTPAHSAFPSGHSTEAHAVATVLLALISKSDLAPSAGDDQKLLREQFMRQAARIAINRTVAGVHYPVDSAVGQMLGLTLGEYLVRRCTDGGNIASWRFIGEAFDGRTDFDFRTQYDTESGQRLAPAFAQKLPGTGTPVDVSPPLKWLWDKALAEWK
jgi:hypothetical protein